jgi:hypothetical protein
MFHLAIELYIKGLLCRRLNEKQRRRLSHHLRGAWSKVKKLAPTPAALSRFDDTIRALDIYWNVRYPDSIVTGGILAGITFDRSGGLVG